MNRSLMAIILVGLVAVIGLLLSSQSIPTAYAVCSPGEWVEWGFTTQGVPYRGCGPIKPVNLSSTYIRIGGSF